MISVRRNMFTNLFPEEAGLLRLILAVTTAAAIAVGITLLIGLEISCREGTRLSHVGGDLSLPVWVACISFWGLLGGAAGILTGAFVPPRRALWWGTAAAGAWFVMLGALFLRDQGGNPPPHPAGVAPMRWEPCFRPSRAGSAR